MNIVDRILDFFVSGWGILTMVALLIGCLVMAEVSVSNSCDELMALARTPHDSLEAKIACNKLRSDTDRNIAIGAAAGAAAGAMAGSRR